jgi:pimeloyl-ACP methyl ester carboxylesterase
VRKRFVTLVFIHGAGFTGDVFAEQLAAFEGAHAPNLPGHLTPGEPQTVAEFAAFIAGYVRDRALQDVVLCGHSLGGAIAIQAALDRAIPVRGLVLLGSGARLRVAPGFLKGFETDFEATAREVASLFFAEPTAERVEWAVGYMNRVGQAQTLRDFRACDAFDVLDRLDELSGVSVLAVTGEGDKMTPPKFARALADRVPGTQARIIAGAGHFVMVEHATETNEAIGTFLLGVL